MAFSSLSSAPSSWRACTMVAVVALEAGARMQQQGLQHVGHAQRLARRVAQGHGRHVVGPFVQVLRSRRIVRVGALGQPAREQGGVRREHGQEHQRDHGVEQRVEVGHGAGRIGFQQVHQRLHQRQRDQPGQHAQRARQQIAQRQPAGGRIIAGDALDHGIDGGAQVGAQHQREGHVRRHHVMAGQRHDQHHHGHAGVRPR